MSVTDTDTQVVSGLDASPPAIGEFDAALDEALASRNSPANEPGDGADTAPTETATEREPVAQEQAPQARSEPPAAGSAPVETPSDIWAAAPSHLRQAFEAERAALHQRARSAEGRLKAADRELARVRSTNARPAPDTTTAQPGSTSANPFDAEEIRRIEEEYPEIAGPIVKLMKGMNDRLQQQGQSVANVAIRDERDARDSEIEVFVKAHPDWEQYVADDRYQPWLEAQPKAVQDAAARAIAVEDGQEAAWLLGMFKSHIGAAATQGQQSRSSSPDPRRERQLQAGRDVGSTAPPTQSGIPDDFDAAVDAIMAQRERASRQGRPA